MNRREWLKLMSALISSSVLNGCSSPEKLRIRVAAHPWPGYELLFLAQARNMLDPALVKLVETPAASANIRALGSHLIEAACMTLDEVLTTRERGIPMTIIALQDISVGADVVLADSSIATLLDLKGKRVAVEHTALGAVMLESALAQAGLQAEDIQIEYFTLDEHEQAVVAKGVNAVVTFEPIKTRLLQRGMKVIFSSAAIPGQIVDVIAVRSEIIQASYLDAVRELVQGHFRGLQVWRQGDEASMRFLAEQLGIRVDEVTAAFSEIQLPDLQENLSWFTGQQPRLLVAAEALGSSMFKSGLLPRQPNLAGLIDSQFLLPAS